MGCNPSKLDGVPAIALCRDRCNFLAHALRHSYAFADAHSAYLHSLSTVGEVLQRFFDHAVESPPDDNSGTGVSLDYYSPASSSSPVHLLSSSDSDSPPKFDSDSEGERCRGRNGDLFVCAKQETLNSGHEHGPFASMGYTKNEASHSVFYSGYGSESHRNYDSGIRTPPPPPAPGGYAWDFINFFESYEFPYSLTTKDSKGKEASRDDDDGWTKNTQNNEKNHDQIAAGEEKSSRQIAKKSDREAKKSKNDSHIDKMGTTKNCSTQSKYGNLKPHLSEITKELQELFMKASEAGDEVSKMFDTSKFRYYHKSSVYQASSNIFSAVSPSFLGVSSPSWKKIIKIDHKPVEDIGAEFKSLSSTLKKLFMWEKKLYQEVKAEEKLRRAHMKNIKQLRRMEEKGKTDVHKIEAVRTLIWNLSTRMKVSIHMIDKICIMINKLRDEELWPQMNKLIHRLSKMWSSMFECHKRQFRVISEARRLEAIALKENLDMGQLELAGELKLELTNWCQNLSNWIDTLKQYIKDLNGWLMRCLMQEPQESKPDLAEAPPVFEAINRWSQALERSTENEVAEAVYALLMNINHGMEKQKVAMQQRNIIIGDKDIERKLLILEKNEKKMERYFVRTLQRRMNILTAESMENLNLKSNLEQIFGIMNKLATDSKQAYEDLDSLCA